MWKIYNLNLKCNCSINFFLFAYSGGEECLWHMSQINVGPCIWNAAKEKLFPLITFFFKHELEYTNRSVIIV